MILTMECHKGLSRRKFILSTASIVIFQSVFAPGISQAREALFEEMPLCKLGDLEQGVPLVLEYPKGSSEKILLVKLGVPAGSGVGEDQDIVAFHTVCPHMGAPLDSEFSASNYSLGPCPYHLAVYDLTRHGMQVTGHAIEPLAQVLLKSENGNLIACGFRSLIYGTVGE